MPTLSQKNAWGRQVSFVIRPGNHIVAAPLHEERRPFLEVVFVYALAIVAHKLFNLELQHVSVERLSDRERAFPDLLPSMYPP